MKIPEFVNLYCADLVRKHRDQKNLCEAYGFPYDDTIEDIDGNPVRVVYGGDIEIPIQDILGMNREEFVKAYPHTLCHETYDRYLEHIIIIEGEEVLNIIRNSLTEEKKRLDNYSLLIDGLA